jgi:aspartyl/asparaginyl beta-hydroxylase (cupin superfamily)
MANHASSLETPNEHPNYSLRRQFLNILLIASETYFMVTFSVVAKPVFTVAVALTLAKPGAENVTV